MFHDSLYVHARIFCQLIQHKSLINRASSREFKIPSNHVISGLREFGDITSSCFLQASIQVMQVLSSSLFVCVRAWKRAHSTLITPNFHTVILFFDLVHSCNVCMLRAYFFFIVVPRTVDNTEWGFFSSLLLWVPVLCLWERTLSLCTETARYAQYSRNNIQIRSKGWCLIFVTYVAWS